MTLKRFILTLSLMALLPVGSLAQGLSEKLDGSKSWRSSSSGERRARQQNNFNEQGGFNKQKEVVGTRELFQERRFDEDDFSQWVALVNYVDAVEVFLAMQDDGYVAKDGEVLKPLPLKGLNVKPGCIVKIRQIRKARVGNFTEADLISELQRTKVLDEDNFVPFPSKNLKTLYEDMDFSFLDERFDQIELPVTRKQAARALKRDLNRLVRTKHRLNEVTQIESTTYQSRNETFLGQLGEQVLGNLASDILFPDRQDVDTFEADYNSNIAVSNFYGNLRTRLNVAPYDRGGDGWLLLNGQHAVTTFESSQLRDNEDDEFTAGSFDLRRHVVVNSGNLDSGSVSLFQYGLTADVLDVDPGDDTDTMPAYYSPYLGVSMLGRWTQFDMNLGLSYRTGGNLDNALGWRYGLGLHIYPIRPLSLDLEYVSQSQPNFIEERTEWQLGRTSVGASLHFKQIAISGGYRWYFTAVDELMSGWYLGGKIYF